MQIKSISWVGIAVPDFPAAMEFFTSVLGLSTAAQDERGVAMLRVGEDQLVELFGPGTGGYANTTSAVAAFEVDDVAAARQELVAAQVEVLTEIGSWNGFEWFYFRGPGTHTFAIKRTPPEGWEAKRDGSDQLKPSTQVSKG